MPRPGLPLVHFNDDRCGNAAELRSVILKARRLADDHAERERVAVAAKTWLLAQIGKRRAATAVAKVEPEQDTPLPTERLAAAAITNSTKERPSTLACPIFAILGVKPERPAAPTAN